MSAPGLRVLWLYPDHMNIYADRGNIAVLDRRCAWRGIGFSLATAGPGEAIDPDAHDLFTSAAARTATRRWSRVTWWTPSGRRSRPLRPAPRCSPSAAAISCWALLRAGDGEPLPGLGLVDLRTVREPGARLIGNVVIEADLGGGAGRMAGFENHGGRTYLGAGESRSGGSCRASATTAGRRRGRAPRAADRHLPARAAAAEEHVARGRADRLGAGARNGQSPSSSRSTTSSRKRPRQRRARRVQPALGPPAALARKRRVIEARAWIGPPVTALQSESRSAAETPPNRGGSPRLVDPFSAAMPSKEINEPGIAVRGLGPAVVDSSGWSASATKCGVETHVIALTSIRPCKPGKCEAPVPGASGLAAGGPEATLGAAGAGQLLRLGELRRGDRHDDQLRDAVAHLDLERLSRSVLSSSTRTSPR